MSNLVASDANHPDFVGAYNPDSRLVAQFYSKPVQNEFKSKQEGRPIFEDVVMVRIFTPGNNLNIIDTFAREDHKARFPVQWARFQNGHQDGQVSGTPLSHWPLLTAAQAEELRHFKFTTVEQIASASDQQLQGVNMIAGMGGHALRQRALNFLKVAGAEAATAANEAELEAVRAENAQNKAALAETNAALDALRQQMASLTAAQPTRGRKAHAEAT